VCRTLTFHTSPVVELRVFSRSAFERVSRSRRGKRRWHQKRATLKLVPRLRKPLRAQKKSELSRRHDAERRAGTKKGRSGIFTTAERYVVQRKKIPSTHITPYARLRSGNELRRSLLTRETAHGDLLNPPHLFDRAPRLQQMPAASRYAIPRTEVTCNT